MLFDYTANENNMAAFAFIEAVSAHEKKTGTLFKEIMGKEGPNVYDVKLTIEGVEVPFIEVMLEWDRQFEQRVGAEAMDLIRGKVNELSKLLNHNRPEMEKHFFELMKIKREHDS